MLTLPLFLLHDGNDVDCGHFSCVEAARNADTEVVANVADFDNANDPSGA